MRPSVGPKNKAGIFSRPCLLCGEFQNILPVLSKCLHYIHRSVIISFCYGLKTLVKEDIETYKSAGRTAIYGNSEYSGKKYNYKIKLARLRLFGKPVYGLRTRV